MKKVEPRTLQGFMELMPNEQILFNNIKKTIEEVYQEYGFLPLDTPVVELSEVLLAKAGGETEKQIYRFNKGDNDLSLRFDLTVPLAKYVAKRYNDLIFPFKRYQIGKVFRGERPQKGRYREFYQCDIDVIGDESLSINVDAEMPTVIYEIFRRLNFGKTIIRINNRKVLNGLFAYFKIEDKAECLRIIDKIDKIGQEVVSDELKKLGINEENINFLLKCMQYKGTNDEKLIMLKSLNIDNEVYNTGVMELEQVIRYLQAVIPEEAFKIDLTIARGLDYYTGTVYETNLVDYPEIGSICSGGRYDNLAEFYTDKKLPGVGISIGLTRLFYQLQEAKIIEASNIVRKELLVIPMNDITYSLKVVKMMRENGIKTSICYLEKGMKQKFKYADRLNVENVLILGEDEEKNNMVTLKNMKDGIQKTISIEDCIKELKK